MSVEDMITVVSAASLTLLRRDMSLNRRLYAWLLGAHLSDKIVYHTTFHLSVHLLMFVFVCMCFQAQT